MAKRISELLSSTSVTGDDLLVVVDSPGNSVNIETKKITVNNFLSSIGIANGENISAAFNGNSLYLAFSTTPSFNQINFKSPLTPANSSYANSSYTFKAGDMFYDSNYLYIAISNSEIKRVALSSF